MPFKPVDTAIQVTFGPLTDSTDFKTLEDAVAYNAAGMYIVIIREWADGSVSVDEVTPAAAGNYAWLHLSQGCYQMQIPASGGASTNNNKTGTLYGMGTATGILPFRTPVYDILAESEYDRLMDGGGVTLTAAGLASVAAEIARVARGYANVYYVDPAGNDSNSGLTPTLAKLTLAGAKSAAAAGSLIVVMPGTYDERNHFKNGVDWLFTRGAVPHYTGAAAGAMWDDSANGANGAVVCRVMGYGRFIHATTGTTQLRPVVRVSNSGSRVLFECLDILNQCSSGTNNPDGVYHSDGELRLKVIGDVSSTQTAGLYLGGLPATAVGVYEAGRFIGSTSNGAGISVQGSTACNFVVIAKYVKATPIAIDLSDYAGTDAQFHVDHVETSGASGRAVYFDGPTLNATATFWNGTFIGTAVGASSAAMECDSGGLVRMYNCRVVNTGVDGAAIGCYGGRVELFNCMVYGGDNAGYDIDTEGTVVVAGTSYRSARTSGTITVAEIQAGVATQTSVNTIDDLLDTEITAIKTVTDQMAFGTANRLNVQVYGIQTDAITAASMASDAGVEIATACMALTDGVETGVTPKQALRAILAMASGSVTGAGSGTEVFTAPDGSTARLTFTVDSDGDRTCSRNL